MFLPAAEDNRGCSDGLAGRLPPEREKEREREEQSAREREREREKERAEFSVTSPPQTRTK